MNNTSDPAMSLKIRPLATLYPTPSNIDWFNRKERKCKSMNWTYRSRLPLRAEIKSEARDRSPIKHFFCMGGGYNAANGLISREITKIIR